MRGSPLLRVLLTLAALLALLVPLHRLTSHPDHVLHEPDSTGKAARKVRLTLTSTTFPFTFEVSHLGQSIWKGEAAESSATFETEMEFPPEGVELLLDAAWQEERATAVKLEITPRDGEPLAQTLWGEIKVSDVLVFKKS